MPSYRWAEGRKGGGYTAETGSGKSSERTDEPPETTEGQSVRFFDITIDSRADL